MRYDETLSRIPVPSLKRKGRQYLTSLMQEPSGRSPLRNHYLSLKPISQRKIFVSLSLSKTDLNAISPFDAEGIPLGQAQGDVESHFDKASILFLFPTRFRFCLPAGLCNQTGQEPYDEQRITLAILSSRRFDDKVCSSAASNK